MFFLDKHSPVHQAIDEATNQQMRQDENLNFDQQTYHSTDSDGKLNYVHLNFNFLDLRSPAHKKRFNFEPTEGYTRPKTLSELVTESKEQFDRITRKLNKLFKFYFIF